MFRILHTSDWHLGHRLHDVPRDDEHRAFLAWLGAALVEHEVDALLIAGDVFDTSNPPASAQADWYRFLAEAHARRPALQIVVIAGNHDSAARLEAPRPLVQALGVRVFGALPRNAADGAFRPAELVLPLDGGEGTCAAQLVALPFLRPADLPPPPPGEGDGDPFVWGMRAVYGAAVAAARDRRAPEEALLLMGHLYLSGAALTADSERRILSGTLHALPADLVPPDVTYAALGHLHTAQRVGGSDAVRYSGAPLPLSFGEGERHQTVWLVTLAGPALQDVRPLRVPRRLTLLRVPAAGPGPLGAVLAELAALPDAQRPPAGAGVPDDASLRWPLLEVRVRLDAPAPGLRREIEEALAGKAVRFVRLALSYPGEAAALADALPEATLAELEPEDVFRRCYAERHGSDVPAELLAAFREIRDAVGQGAGR